MSGLQANYTSRHQHPGPPGREINQFQLRAQMDF